MSHDLVGSHLTKHSFEILESVQFRLFDYFERARGLRPIHNIESMFTHLAYDDFQ